MPFLPPLLQVPPASRGEPRRGSVSPACRFPLLPEGNQKGSVSPACRFPLLPEGNQKGSVPLACRGNLKEGVRNFAYFRTLSLTRLLQVGGSVFSRHCRS
jgi:hypothetical protein